MALAQGKCHLSTQTSGHKCTVIKNKCIIANVMANTSPTQSLNPFKTLIDSDEKGVGFSQLEIQKYESMQS